MRRGWAIAAAVLFASAAPAWAQDFHDKTIKINVGSPPGTGYDTFARLVSRTLGRFLPGNPNVVVNNMPGASGVNSVNYLYNLAPKDGTFIGLFDSAMPFYEAIGQLGIRFKSADLSWIGSLTRGVNIISVWHTTGVKTIDDAKKKEIVLGAVTGGGIMSVYPAMVNAILGTKFKIVTGYEGSASVDLALQKGEVEARGILISSWRTGHPDWLKNRLVTPIVQIGFQRDAELPDVPLLVDLAQNDEQARMFKFVSGPMAYERPFAGPPGLPPEILALYRKAFADMEKDAAFIEDAKKGGVDLDPLSGEEIAKIAAEIVATPKATVEAVKAMAAGG